MNIHPLLVHFPIALLTTYAVLELIRLKNFYIRAFLVILGTIAGYLTIIAGLFAKLLVKNPDTLHIINYHETVAITTIVIFSIIAFNYILAIRQGDYVLNYKKTIWALALLGVTGIATTAALGGSIVYGPTNDPVTGFIYHLFFK